MTTHAHFGARGSGGIFVLEDQKVSSGKLDWATAIAICHAALDIR